MNLNNSHLSDISDIFRTDIGHRKEYWAEFILNDRLIKVAMYVKKYGKIARKGNQRPDDCTTIAYYNLHNTVRAGTNRALKEQMRYERAQSARCR